ncbi:MAG: hypothetical protein CL471_10815 [Acidobacteria bacterium]|jgi:hypothetical protein|nr:hypothetical protein [Acidobacteriota bacterium]MBU21569.1 hypothetical protein [Acidobacteriota bacterium]|tara:strand:- start:1258 stop:1443 length:186 start_codon:yes stop_codon:yes gene_type:complete
MTRHRVAELTGRTLWLAAALGVLLPTALPPSAQGQSRYTNLQVLPADISQAEMNEIMLANL